jgi:hypothetical protein
VPLITATALSAAADGEKKPRGGLAALTPVEGESRAGAPALDLASVECTRGDGRQPIPDFLLSPGGRAASSSPSQQTEPRTNTPVRPEEAF